jgi:hypothetical protein
MRSFIATVPALCLVLGVGVAWGQTAPPPAAEALPPPAPVVAPAPPPAPVVAPAPAPVVSPAPVVPPPVVSAAPAPVMSPQAWTPATAARFRTGRLVYGLGTGAGVLGTALVFTGAIVTGLVDKDIGTYLVYGGAAAQTASFILGATGLGLQHNALDEAGMPTGRGLFGVGTAFNVVGMVGIGAGYLLGGAQFITDPEQNRAAVVAVSVTGTVLMIAGGVFYFFDARRMNRIVSRLTTF